MLHYLLVLLGVVGVAVFWVLFQIWLTSQDSELTNRMESSCEDCEKPCGKQVISSCPESAPIK